MKAVCEQLARAILRGASSEVPALRSRLSAIRTRLTVERLPEELRLLTQLPPPLTGPEELSSEPGIYLISASNSNLHYVGLAADIRDRFFTPGYGHLTNNKCRSAEVFATGAWCIRELAVFSTAPTDIDFQLSYLELLYHAVLSIAGLRFVNSESFLGRIGGGVGSALIVCELAGEDYRFFGSTSLAVQDTQSTALPAVAHGYQHSAAGYAVRWASDAEIAQAESISGSGACPRSELVLDGADARRITALDAPRVVMSGSGRNASVRWLAGPLSEDALAHFRKFSRGGRYKTVTLPSSGFRGVSWHSGSRTWQCRAKNGPGPKQIWQTGRADWATALDAAVFREEKILQEGWQQFNFGRYASNAVEINSGIGSNRFAVW